MICAEALPKASYQLSLLPHNTGCPKKKCQHIGDAPNWPIKKKRKDCYRMRGFFFSHATFQYNTIFHSYKLQTGNEYAIAVFVESKALDLLRSATRSKVKLVDFTRYTNEGQYRHQ